MKATLFQGLFYAANSSLHLEAFCDSDWGSCTHTSRSVTGICLFLGTSLVAWSSKKQMVVSRSTAEAELRALADTACDLSWFHLLLSELHVPQPRATDIHCDNQAALDIAADPVFHPKTKHFALDCHFVREQVHSNLIRPVFVPSSLQLADILTKGLPRQHHFGVFFQVLMYAKQI